RCSLFPRLPDDGRGRRHARHAGARRGHQRHRRRRGAAADGEPRPRGRRDALSRGDSPQDGEAVRGRRAARRRARRRAPVPGGRAGRLRQARRHRVPADRRRAGLFGRRDGDRQEPRRRPRRGQADAAADLCAARRHGAAGSGGAARDSRRRARGLRRRAGGDPGLRRARLRAPSGAARSAGGSAGAGAAAALGIQGLFARIGVLLGGAPQLAFLCDRGVAQPGRVLRSGRRCRWFKSSHPDHSFVLPVDNRPMGKLIVLVLLVVVAVWLLRRALRYFNLDRVVLAGLFFTLSLVYGDALNLGAHSLYLFRLVAAAYMVAGIVFHAGLRRWREHFNLQLTLQACADVVAITLLMYASGGIRSGLGVMLLISLTGAAIVAPRRLSFLYAALATIALLLEQGYWVLL